MFSFFHRSLRNKLLVAFMAIGLLPYLLFLTYALFLGERKILDKTVADQYYRADMIIHAMQTHLHRIEKEVLFLSQLDIMDDLIAEDIDKRISRLLTQKYRDYGLNLTLLVLDTNRTIIAASHTDMLAQSLKLPFHTDPSKHYHIVGDTLYIYAPVHASFDAKRSLGMLVLRYALSNLNSYLIHQQDRHAYLHNPRSGITVGDQRFFQIQLDNDHGNVIAEAHLIVYKKLNAMLEGWYFVYGVDTHTALAFLYDFIDFMLYLFPLIFVTIVIVAISYSTHVVKPVKRLTHITDTIIRTQDYSATVRVSTHDEIAQLSNSFNKMIRTTHEALQHLEHENNMRLQRLIQLIDIFNTIIQTKSESDCIAVSVAYLKELTAKEDITFSKEPQPHSGNMALYGNDFEHNEPLYYGYISLDLDTFDDTNEQEFYRSIATMIMLQLDRIRLIERTLSASHAKSAFISSMSHELRTPLNAIIGFAQYLLAYESLTDDQQDSIAHMESSAQYLLGMINDILDIAKIEAGKMEVHKQDVDLLALVRHSCAMLQPLADDKQLSLQLLNVPANCRVCQTDPKLLKQIVLNLLSNAIKFTDEGGVSVTLSSEKDRIVITIIDTGIGIEPAEIETLFHDFTQAGNVMHKEQKGTGLGLSLSKKMALLLKGDISLHSRGIGTGCRATLFIKL